MHTEMALVLTPELGAVEVESSAWLLSIMRIDSK